MSIYSRSVFVAHKALAASGIAVSKSHLRELVAALCGFNTLAALQASPYFPEGAPVEGLLVLADVERAQARCQALMAEVKPLPVLRALYTALDTTPAVGAVVLADLNRDSESLKRLIHAEVMSAPKMTGTVDDYEARVQDMIRPNDNPMSIKVPEELARSFARDTGPVRDLEGSAAFNKDRLIGSFEGRYTDAKQESGLVSVTLQFQLLSPSLFLLEDRELEFESDEDDDAVTVDDMDYQFAAIMDNGL
jgi:hypothetical protein